ncbi:MAG: metallophosphoesterase family protein [Planctomycetota bacterium]|nr:metallophosphoesterase family protein [Planctomycetota bacterium]
MAHCEPIAILSDIHGNLEAAEAVFSDIAAQGVERILNLGDTVGYGPDPEACVDLVAVRCQWNLCGNHDYAVLHEAEGFNPIARAAVDYVRNRMKPSPQCQDADTLRRWQFLENLEPIYEEDCFEAMHASPRQPITEYVLPSDPEMDPHKVREIFAAMSHRVAFIGHTHFPGIIEEDRDGFLMPQMFAQVYHLGERRALINVGSVGQPRDRDTRCCYVIFDGETVVYRRVAYDIETTVAKVRRCGGLHEVCGLRLREGR